MKARGTGRWAFWGKASGDGADPMFRLAAAVVAQAIEDAGRGIALGRQSPAWADALSAVRFLLIDLWDDRCPWHVVVQAGVPKDKLITMVAAQTGHAAFVRCVEAAGLSPIMLRRI